MKTKTEDEIKLEQELEELNLRIKVRGYSFYTECKRINEINIILKFLRGVR